MRNPARLTTLALLAFSIPAALAAFGGCGGADDTATEISAGAGGEGGTAGSAGTAGEAGSAGSGNAGEAGSGSAGSAGTAGEAGSAGSGNAGEAGESGNGGEAGESGNAGESGESGNGGEAGESGNGGEAGESGNGGEAGESGNGGEAGENGSAGDDGAGGSDSPDGGLDPDSACVANSAEATLVKKPVDIIFVIDNSGSMSQEIKAVQSNINNNFAQIIGQSGLDYRVIMLSRHGSATSYKICVSEPLSGTNCSPIPAQPVNTERFFHYSVSISSTNSLSQITATYKKKDEFNLAPNGWSAWVRPDALKVFVELSDDSPSGGTNAATNFDKALLALDPAQFGTAAKRNYVFHSIVGLKENTPKTAPYLPDAPIVTAKCSGGAVNAGTEYQKLSQLTGGLRFPLCENGSFDIIFQTIAQGVVEGSTVACDFPIPPDPPGTSIDPSTVVIQYTPSDGGLVTKYSQVDDASQCASGGFYIENKQIKLCPAVCSVVQTDTKAKLDLLFGCSKL